MKIIRVTQTNLMLPSQWDAWDEEGNYYYLRFRHGCGEVRQYQSPDWYNAPPFEYDENSPIPFREQDPQFIRNVADFKVDDPLAGWITLEEFAEHAGIELAENLMTTDFSDHLRDELIMKGVINLIPEDEWGVKRDSDQDENQNGPEEGTTD